MSILSKISRNKSFGKISESIIKIYLENKGYEVKYSRYRIKNGEIDLICKLENTIVFIEVKSTMKSNTDLYTLGERISERQISNIRRCMLEFMNNSEEYSQYSMQLDIILFNSANEEIVHIENHQ
ncbi:YraN family protein [Rickettsiales bacterium]|nr:YraN family protein [Rickettsiales bacterium]